MTDHFAFTGDFRFTEKDAWLEFRIPMSVLKSLIGSSTKRLQIERYEIVGLLRIIEANLNTSESDLAIVRGLLKKA